MTENTQLTTKPLEKAPTVRKKLVAFFLTLALACTGFTAIPATAFADDATGGDAEASIGSDVSKEVALTMPALALSNDTLKPSSLTPLAGENIVVYDAVSLINALGSASGAFTITLGANINMGSNWANVSAGQDVTLRGAYTLSGTADYTLGVAEGGKLTIEGANFSNNVIAVLNVGTLVLANATFSNNMVAIGNEGVFTMNGGTITGSGDCGIYNRGTFTMNKGTITKSKNGGVANGWTLNSYTKFTGTFTLRGGSIKDNKTSGATAGGGVYNEKGSAFVMTGGAITNNTARDGGGIFSHGACTINGGKITDNTAKRYGGGMVSTDPDKLKVGAKAKFSDNRAKVSYKRASKYDKLYKKNIKSKKWSYNLKQGFNYFDIAVPWYDRTKVKVLGKPSISGKGTISLKKGYKATSQVYVGKGYPAPKFSVTKNTGAKQKVKINSKGKLTIPRGLKKGTYKITIQAKNSAGTKTKNITIKVK